MFDINGDTDGVVGTIGGFRAKFNPLSFDVGIVEETLLDVGLWPDSVILFVI